MYKLFIKRLLDIIFSFLLLLILFPLMVLIWVLVRIYMGSPVLFKHQRPGLNEKIFTLYKFRTMNNNRSENGMLLPDIERTSKFGLFLRDFSLDELPELYNILIGEMSFVGPRPHIVQYLPLYNTEQKRRHSVKPGLTGLAQVTGRNATTYEERFVKDVHYVDNYSFCFDFKIIIKTFLNVIIRKDVHSNESITLSRWTGNK